MGDMKDTEVFWVSNAILYEDDSLIVLHKKRGWVVHQGAGHTTDTIAHAIYPLLISYSETSKREGRAGIVHRLDKDTSGVLLIARTEAAHDFYAHMFATRTVKKTYLSIVKGCLIFPQGEVRTYIARDTRNRKKFCNYADASQGKQAISHYRVLYSHVAYSVVEWSIETGRTHQIRLHAQYLGCPIVGDRVYARAIHDKYMRDVSLMLHAWKIRIPMLSYQKQEREFCAPISNDMKRVFSHIGYSVE